ncbi:AzlC family ABC transporter permease [Lapidilactobacillus gannanensis]|uniref:AzlC family ABC transporter permease n=1 Tax=Lapidilactobacillus gannanensis TaxID=2486002 RepID=A0ABW4BNB6_9LACO|nr:AzlC family ABC transporter permease [Lapidilactobacillus gannanensis]
MNDDLTRRAGWHEAIPIGFSYFGISLALGIVGRAAGISPGLMLLMSALIFAGSAQFVLISLLLTQEPVMAIVAATFLINARLILLGITLAPHFKQQSFLKTILLASLLTDESFALAINKINYTKGRLTFAWFHGAALLPYLVCLSATLIGALLGGLLTNPERFGVDFAVIAMFIGLTYLQFESDQQLPKTLQLILIGCSLVMVYFGMIIIPGRLLILAVTLVGCAIGVILKHVYF